MRCPLCPPEILEAPSKPLLIVPAAATIASALELPHDADQAARARKPRMRRAAPQAMTATAPGKNEAAATITAGASQTTAVALKGGLFESIALQNAALGY